MGGRDPVGEVGWWGCSILLLGASGMAFAGATTDGTVGPKTTLSGDFEVEAGLGRREGGNLFHSFERFSVETGESATFTGPTAIDNVISRVTGGDRSTIDGRLASTIPGADFYFLNPAGMLFGSNASLDVLGAFHVSTADELRFEDGSAFSALDPDASRFTLAAPEAFGFLGVRPAPITVDGSRLQVPTGEALSIVGGEVTLARSDARATAGTVAAASLGGPGRYGLLDGEVVADRMADLTIDGGEVSTTGDGGGVIRLRGGVLTIEGGASVLANNDGPTDATGGIDVSADTIVAQGAAIRTEATGFADAGSVNLTARSLTIADGTQVSASTFARGDAGVVAIDADQLTIDSGASGALTGIFSQAEPGTTGDAGQVEIETGLMVVLGAEIATSTFAEGDAGVVEIAAGEMLLSGGGIFSQTSRGSIGQAGRVAIDAGQVTIRDRAVVSAATRTLRDAGSVRVVADGLLIVGTGGGELTGVTTSANKGSSGDGGAITVVADDVR